jgi:hypothetical protein
MQTSLEDWFMKDKSMAQAEQRALQYWLIDGIAELVMGGFFVLLGLYFGAQAVFPEDSPVGSMLTPAMLMVFVVAGLTARSLIRMLKERLTYPRTGYVAYHQPSKKRRWLTLALAFGMAMLVSALFASAPASLAWIPAVSGLVIGAYWVYHAHRMGVLRFYALAALSAIAGTTITLAGVGETLGIPLFYIVLGLALMISGGLTMLSYLRRQPVQPDEPEERFS